MATNKGIPVINNFDLYSNKAIDSRLTIENEQELGELVNKGAIYDGMIFYRKDAQKFFQAQFLESGLKISEFGGSSGENVSPTLFLIDFQNGTIRTTITEQEKQNLEKGLYNQVVYGDLQSEAPFDVYTPSKLFVVNGEYCFTNFDKPTVENPSTENEKITFKSMSYFIITIGDKNANNEYPITIEKGGTFNIGSESSPSEKEITPLDIAFNTTTTTTLTTEQVNLIKSLNQKYVYIKLADKLVPNNTTIGYIIDLGDLGITIYIISSIDLMAIDSDYIIRSSIAIQNNVATFVDDSFKAPTDDDNGKVLSVVNGKAIWSVISGDGKLIILNATETSSNYTITLTVDQFNKIYDNEYGVILNLGDDYSFLPTIKRNLLNGKKTITLGGIDVITRNSITGLSTAIYNNVDFTTDSLTKTLSTLEYSFLNYKIDDNNNLKLRYLAKESSSATEKNITGYALPTIENLTQDKEYTIKATKTKLEWEEKQSSPRGGGTPTLSLVDMATEKVRTTITESEKNNLANGVYNQVIYTSTFDNPFDVYSPCKIIVSNGLSGAFAQFDCTPNDGKTSGTIQSFTIYDYTIGTKNASGEYPINIVKHQNLNVGGTKTLMLSDIMGTVRTTLTPQEVYNLNNGFYDYVAYIDKNNQSTMIGFNLKQGIIQQGQPIFYSFAGEISSRYEEPKITKVDIYYIVIDDVDSDGNYPFTVELTMSYPFASGSSSETPKITLTQEQLASMTLNNEITFTSAQYEIIKTSTVIDVYLSVEGNTSLLYRMDVKQSLDENLSNPIWVLVSNTATSTSYLTQTAKDNLKFSYNTITANLHPITEANEQGSEAHYWQIRFTSTPNVNDYFYTMPDPRNEKNPYILTSSNGEAKWQILKTYYNHFIYLALETATKGTATIRINFTTTSNELINTLDKLKSALGETFTLGGNGSIVNGSTYGTTYMVNQNGITGVLNGAQSVFNFADGTLTITDSVKQA